jgi:hypothetical protein
MKQKKRRRRTSRSANQRKLSELIWEFAGDFIRMGETAEEMESLLNAACSAWNLACLPEAARTRQVDHYMVQFVRCNPDLPDGQAEATRSNMERLIQQKLKMFPADQRRIVSARIIGSGTSHRIEVASARFK